jgi:intraflagellar transport protein 81
MSADLKLVATALSQPPFNKKWSIIQLHDELPVEDLLITIFEIAAYIDESNQPSVFAVDRDFQEKVYRLADFLRMLKFEPAVSSV